MMHFTFLLKINWYMTNICDGQTKDSAVKVIIIAKELTEKDFILWISMGHHQLGFKLIIV